MKLSLMTFVLAVAVFAADGLMAQQPDGKSPHATARNTARALRRQLEAELRENPTGCCADSELRAALENYLANDPLEKAISALKEVISQSPGSLDAAKATAAMAALEASDSAAAESDAGCAKCARCQECPSACPVKSESSSQDRNNCVSNMISGAGIAKSFGDLFNITAVRPNRITMTPANAAPCDLGFGARQLIPIERALPAAEPNPLGYSVIYRDRKTGDQYRVLSRVPLAIDPNTEGRCEQIGFEFGTITTNDSAETQPDPEAAFDKMISELEKISIRNHGTPQAIKATGAIRALRGAANLAPIFWLSEPRRWKLMGRPAESANDTGIIINESGLKPSVAPAEEIDASMMSEDYISDLKFLELGFEGESPDASLSESDD